jgi:hypothetical protein
MKETVRKWSMVNGATQTYEKKFAPCKLEATEWLRVTEKEHQKRTKSPERSDGVQKSEEEKKDAHLGAPPE